MSDISTNRSIRLQQFRATARRILKDASSRWGTADRVRDLARAMEQAYAAGSANTGRPEEDPASAGHVRWVAIPRRSQDVLQDIAHVVRTHANDIRSGEIIAAIEGAGETSPRGDRARFALWRIDGELMRRIEGGTAREWASSSVSALVRLGIFKVFELHDPDIRMTSLTALGLATIEAAVADRSIYVLE
ncbi:MAG TPA: hypothetical protein VIA98_11195 [Allosphingosinicella sp.]|jgi:hypothetical protein